MTRASSTVLATLVAVIAVGGAAGSAAAGPIAPPAGWLVDPALATPPQATRFGGAKTKVSVWAYRTPARGAVLYVNRAEAELPADRRDALATAELEELRAAMRRQGGTAKAEASVQRVTPDKQLEAALTWRDAAVGLVDASRMLIAADAQRTVAVTGQCVLAIDAPADVVKACEAALGTLDTDVPAATRVALSIVGDPEAGAPAPAIESDRPRVEPARLDEASRIPMPTIAIEPAQPAVDRRPIYVGGGLVMLAILFYLSRRRRDRFGDEAPARADEPRAAADDDDADDADDLHAAADAPKDGASHDR